MANIINWGKALRVIKELNTLNATGYFDLQKFCEVKGLDYVKISSFLEVANSIINGESKLYDMIKEHKKIAKQLTQIPDADLQLTF